ncbi:MAG: hypothetical protein ACRDWT_14685 [Jatrophihabitantaceae bacterium]
MPTRAEILDPQRKHPFTVTASSGDRRTSVSSSVIRCIYDGQRAVAVGSDASSKTQIAAMLDLLHLHNDGADPATAVVTNRDEITIILGDHKDEAVDALCTLRDTLLEGPVVNIRIHQDDGTLTRVGQSTLDLADAKNLYPGWSDDLRAVATPPPLVDKFARSADMPEFRAYPMLTSSGWWSMRLEGLEVGRLRDGQGWLDVGKDASSGAQSEARKVWQQATSLHNRHSVDERDPDSVSSGVDLVRAFAAAWLTNNGSTPVRQNEHALESRILRGHTTLRTTQGLTLELISGRHPVVNWGSQFPTKWGRQGSARYLDALLRDGTTPWAIEMKVAGSAGVGQYYRHALAQAVLYREFIKRATPLHWWFTDKRLEPADCKSAVVVPDLTGASAVWRPGLHRLCRSFGVDLIEVDHASATLR